MHLSTKDKKLKSDAVQSSTERERKKGCQNEGREGGEGIKRKYKEEVNFWLGHNQPRNLKDRRKK